VLDIKLKLRPGHTSERAWLAPSPLRQLFWNVTYACNYRCPICFTDAGTRQEDELTTAEAVDLVRRAHEAGIEDIIISGGEPFMRGDIVTVLAEMGRMGMTARIATNGSLVSDELLARLREETLTKSFQISLDTLDPDLYAEVHGAPPEALESVLAASRSMQRYGFHTTVSVRLTPRTLEGIPAILDRAAAEGWATVTIHLPVHTRRVSGAFPQTTDLIGLLGPVFEHFVRLGGWVVETYIPWVQFHPAMKRLERRVRVVHRGCRAGRDRLTVNPTGWLSPCVCMDVPEAYVGNVRRDDLREVFENAPLCRMLRSPQEHGICADCPHVAVCGGGCRATAFALTGTLDGPDESCPLRQSRSVRDGGLRDAAC